MGLFDNYGSDETVENTITQDPNDHVDGLFDDYGTTEDTHSDESTSNDNHSNEHESDEHVDENNEHVDENNESDVEHNSNESVQEQKPLSYKDLDEYFSKQKQFEAAQAELAKYKEIEAQQLAAKKAEEDKANEMPDPVYKPEEYRKWQYEQNRKMEDAYNARLEQFQNTAMVENLTSKLDSTYNSTVETYGKDVVSKAEQWAADIIKQSPKEALAILKNNPSWDFIVKEYNKYDMEAKFKADPDAYIAAQVEAKLNEAKANEQVNQNVRDNKPKRRTPSINSINTTPDPQKSVPTYLQGLF